MAVRLESDGGTWSLWMAAPILPRTKRRRA